MNKRKEKIKDYKKSNWKRGKEHKYGYSETSVNRNSWDYGASSKAKPWERHYSVYSYNTYEDRYNNWKDNYRHEYRGDNSTYNSLYDTDDDYETNRYQSRIKYDGGYYDNSEYSTYYDEDDTDYMDKKIHSECKNCNKHSKKRKEKKVDDSKYLYRYEEFHPEYSHNYSHIRKNKTYVQNETSHPRHRSDMDIYAIHDILGQNRFKYKRYNSIEPKYTPGIFSETDIESHYGRQTKRKRRPKYNIYSTQTPNNATAFNRKVKSSSPEKLLSVTDYQHIPILAFEKKNKKHKSDIVYLPLVMKEEDGKKTASPRTVKTLPMYKITAETAEKPLEDKKVYSAMDSGKYNIFNYKKGRRSEKDLNLFKETQKGINVYAVSSGISQVFRKSVRNSKIAKKTKSETSLKSGNFTEQVPDTGSYVMQTTNTGASNEAISVEPTDSGGSIILPLQTSSMAEPRKSMAEPTENKKETNETSTIKKSTGGIKNSSVARKSLVVDKANFNNNDTFDTGLEGQNIYKSVIRQSYVPSKRQSVVDEKKSLVTGQQRFGGGFQNNQNYQNTPLKSIIKSSVAPHNKTVPQKSYVVDQQDLHNPAYLETNLSNVESEGQDLHLKQNTAGPINDVMLSNVLSPSQTSLERERSLAAQQPMPKSLLRQIPKKSMVRDNYGTQKGQSILGRDQVIGIEEQNTQKSITRQSGIGLLQRGQSAAARAQSMEKQRQSTKKSVLNQSGSFQKGQSFVGVGKTEETEWNTAPKSLVKSIDADQIGQTLPTSYKIIEMGEQSSQKSMIRQSGVPKRGYSAVDQKLKPQRQSIARQTSVADQVGLLEKEKQNTQKSIAREGSVLQRNQSFLDKDPMLQTQRQNMKVSSARQSNAIQRGQSLMDREKIFETERQSTQNKSIARQSNSVRRGESFVDTNYPTGIVEQNAPKSMTRQISVANKRQSYIPGDVSEGIERQSTQKSLARRSNVTQGGQSFVGRGTAQRGESFVDRNYSTGIGEQNVPRSMVRQSSAAYKGQSFIPEDVTVGIEGQSTQKNLTRKSNVTQGGQSFTGRSTAQRGQSVSRNYSAGIGEQNVPKSMVRQSSAAYKGPSFIPGDITDGTEEQNPDRSLARQSNVAQKGKSFVDRDKVSRIEVQSIQKSLARKSNMAEIDQSFAVGGQITGGDGRKSLLVDQQRAEDNLQEIDTLSQQPEINNLEQDKELTRETKTSLAGSNVKQPSVVSKRPTKSKSNTLMKRAISKLYSKREDQFNKDQDSASTAPMVDVIMNEENKPRKSQILRSSTQQPASETSSGSSKQQLITSKTKKSKKSKLSRPFKSLLSRSKKPDSRLRQPSIVEEVQETEVSNTEGMDEVPIEQKQTQSFEGSSEQYTEEGDESNLYDKYYHLDTEDSSLEEFPPILKGYDLTQVLYFLQIAQFLVGVTIHDKLMEIFSVL